MLQSAEHVLGLLRVPGGRSSEEDGERGRLRVLGNVDDLLETGHTQGHVLGGHAGKVERIERHLRGGLTQALGSQGAHHLTGGTLRLSEP